MIVKIQKEIVELKKALNSKFESDNYYIKVQAKLDILTEILNVDESSITPKTVLQEEENLLWKQIEDIQWVLKNHTYSGNFNKATKDLKKKLSNEEFENLSQFVSKKHSEIREKYEDAWLGNDGGKGIEASDDSWSDLTAEIVGRGRSYYENITVAKMRTMARHMDYCESFLYMFH